MNYTELSKLSDSNFKRLVVVKRHTFESMRNILKKAYVQKHHRRGRHSKLTVEDMLFFSLNYLRSYDTFFETGFKFGVSESTAQQILIWVEDTLISDGQFSLPIITEDKKENQRISRERILIENINAKVKTFKSMAHKYRNRRKRHLLRTALICGIINFELEV